MLEIKNASLYYADRTVFENLSFTVLAGKWLAVLGRSGVGKTSLLRLIAGLHHFKTQKNTLIKGQALWQQKVNFDVAYMAQQDGLLPWLSILDNVVLSSHLTGKKPDFAEAKHLLAAVGLQQYVHQKPKALSGGMRQRVALARTLIQHHDLILMDEPFSALDALTRIEMQTLSANLLRQAGKTLVMVTHDPWEALRLADTILILKGETTATIAAKMDLPVTQTIREATDAEMIQAYSLLLQHLNAAPAVSITASNLTDT